MTAVLRGRIVAGWARNAFGMPTYHVHQADYPEIEAEGRTGSESCRRLIQLLVQAHDFASEGWRREPLRLALVDAQDFATSSVSEPEPSLTARLDPARLAISTPESSTTTSTQKR